MLSEGFDRFIEIGPGNVLSGFVKKTAAGLGVNADIITIQNKEDLEKVISKNMSK